MPILSEESYQYITLVSDELCGIPRKYFPSLLLSHLLVSIFRRCLRPNIYFFGLHDFIKSRLCLYAFSVKDAPNSAKRMHLVDVADTMLS